jgi:hypothetical protein
LEENGNWIGIGKALNRLWDEYEEKTGEPIIAQLRQSQFTLQDFIQKLETVIAASRLDDHKKMIRMSRMMIATCAIESSKLVILECLSSGDMKARPLGAYSLGTNWSYSSGAEGGLSGPDKCMPSRFWSFFNQAKDKLADWPQGSFSFTGSQSLKWSGSAHEVLVDLDGLEIVSRKWQKIYEVDGLKAANSRPQSDVDQSQSGDKRPGGRRPAKWWPDFSEELAVYVIDNGLPETQDELIANVQTAMTVAGKGEPSRSQIQPVIRQLFARFR